MSLLTFTLTGLLILGGATLSAMAGFGFGISTIPFLLLLHPPKFVIAMTTVVAMAGVTVQWFRVRRHADYRLVLPMAAGAALGLPLGGYVLAVISDSALKVLIGAAVLVAAGAMLRRTEVSNLPARRPPLLWIGAAGFVAGLLSTTVGQPGPPIAFVTTWSRLVKETARATIVSFFVLLDIGSIATLLSRGLLPKEVWLVSLGLLPFYFAGLMVGDYRFHRTSQVGYRRLVFGVLAVAAAVGVFNGVNALLG